MGRRFVFLIVLFVFLNGGIFAGGWNNTLLGIRAIAIGGAFSGIADDPSAIYHNPAGLVQQESGLAVSISGFHIRPVYAYTMPDGRRAESRFQNTLPQIFLSYRLNDRITLGFGVYVPYAGSGVDWKANDLGFPFKSTMAVMSFSPTIAYKVSDVFSLGFNLNYYRGIFSLDTEMQGLGPISTDESGSAMSASLGLMFHPNEKLRLGLRINGPASMQMSGISSIMMEVEGFGQVKLNLDSETRFKLPWDVELGLSYRFSERFLVAASAQYTFWSALKVVEKTIKNVPQTGDLVQNEPMNFNNILILRLGFEYTLPEGLSIRAGFGYDRYATPDDSLNISNIDVNKMTFIGGLGYRTGSVIFDVVYISAQGRERDIVSPLLGFPLRESFNLSASILGMGVTFLF
jgi:long-chain fatty acid transport protein